MDARKAMLTRPAGRLLADYLFEEEARAIIRAHLATERTNKTAVARDIGISRNDLVRFLEGVSLFEPAYGALLKWCEGRPTPYIGSETLGVALLSRWANRSNMRRVRAAVAEAVLRVYRENGVKVPSYGLDALKAGIE